MGAVGGARLIYLLVFQHCYPGSVHHDRERAKRLKDYFWSLSVASEFDLEMNLWYSSGGGLDVLST